MKPSDMIPRPPGRNGLAQPAQVWPEAGIAIQSNSPITNTPRTINAIVQVRRHVAPPMKRGVAEIPNTVRQSRYRHRSAERRWATSRNLDEARGARRPMYRTHLVEEPYLAI